MEPADVAMLLQQQLVIVLPCAVSDVEQDRGVADHLFLTHAGDILIRCHMLSLAKLPERKNARRV